MKKLILLLFLVTLSISATPKQILVSNVSKGTGADSIDLHKIYTATKLAVDMCKDYITVPDSVRRKAIEAADPNTTFDILAKHLKANFVLYSSIDVFHNMLRANITLVDITTNTESLGFGYSDLRYTKNGEKIYDVAMLTALQRAVMNVTNDSTQYSHQPKQYQVLPTKTLVIGGFMFDNNDALLIWKLFTNKSVSSYYSSESIYQAAKESDRYSVYDLTTRDSMYANFNLFMMDNSTQPSKTEMKILSTFGVQNYVFGIVKRVENHAEVKVILAEMVGERLNIIRFEEGILKEDVESKLGDVVKELTSKLLLIDDSKRVRK